MNNYVNRVPRDGTTVLVGTGQLLVRLLLGESALLATGGAIGGVLLAGLITRWLAVPERVIGARGQYGAVGEFATAHMDAAVLGFAGLATLGSFQSTPPLKPAGATGS